ncbi:MAG: sugar phosphate isomerase/epimerase [Clostridia bacterium]|nr:sugar phosphate isomerase/epimerase [Clostridia bacterium]
MHRVLCSTGALIGRPNGRDWHLLNGCRDQLHCDGFEFMMYDTWYDDWEQIADYVEGLRLTIPTLHCEKCIGEEISLRGPGDWEDAFRKFDQNCRLAVRLGAKLMVLHLWDGVTSDRYFDNNLAAYPYLRERAEKQGILLTVENVVCNQGDPLTHWRVLQKQYPDAQFTFDTKMAAFHDQLECMYLPENADLWAHIAHLHINDYAGGYLDWSHLRTLHIGDGRLNFEKLFAFLRDIHYAGDYTVEATSFLPDGVIHWQDLNRSVDRVRALLNIGG